MKTVVINSDTDQSYDRLFRGWCIIHEGSSYSPYIPWGKVDLVLLVGDNTDVHPNLYGEVPSDLCGDTNKLQDLEAFGFIDRADNMGIPIMGICKGAQQLCVYNGGKLVQHVDRVGTHLIAEVDDPAIEVPADHHQVMVPRPAMGVLWKNLSTGYPEVVQGLDCLVPWVGFQYHPEWAHPESAAFKLFTEKRDELCR